MFHPKEDAECVSKTGLSSSFDLTLFKFRRLERIGPSDTRTAFLVLANDIGLYGFRYPFFATRALDESVCVKSQVVFGKKNKFKAFAERFFAGGYSCLSYQGKGESDDDFDIQDLSTPLTAHAVDPYIKGDCAGKSTLMPRQVAGCGKGGTSGAPERHFDMKLPHIVVLTFFIHRLVKPVT